MAWMTLLFWTAWAVIGYTYVLFPILLAAAARWFGKRAPADGATGSREEEETLPRVAMVVAAHNEAGVIQRKLANTWELDYPPDRFELLIGTDGCSDGTAELLQRETDARLRLFAFARRRGKISVLNDLAVRTDAEILVMSDANTMYAPDAVRRLVRGFRDPRVGIVSGELRLEQGGGVSGEGAYWRYEQWIKRNESRLGFLLGCNGGIFAIRRALYRPLPPSTLVEDFVLTLRVLEQKYRVRFEPAARATEPPCPSARAEMVRKSRIGAGGFQALGLTAPLLHPRRGWIAFAYWGHKLLRWLVPHFFLCGLAASAALASQPLYAALLGLQVGGGLLAAWTYHSPEAVRLPGWLRLVSYFYLMNYALFCGFLRFLFRTQRVTWDRVAAAPAEISAAR